MPSARHSRGPCLLRPAARPPPTSAPSTMRRCGPVAARSGYVARLRCSATRSAAPSTSAPHGCGWPVRVNGESTVASQHSAPMFQLHGFESYFRHVSSYRVSLAPFPIFQHVSSIVAQRAPPPSSTCVCRLPPWAFPGRHWQC